MIPKHRFSSIHPILLFSQHVSLNVNSEYKYISKSMPNRFSFENRDLTGDILLCCSVFPKQDQAFLLGSNRVICQIVTLNVNSVYYSSIFPKLLGLLSWLQSFFFWKSIFKCSFSPLMKWLSKSLLGLLPWLQSFLFFKINLRM